MIYADGMVRHSPTLEGFRLMWSRPSLGLAEIAWRWSFWAAAWFLVLFAAREYFDSLRVGSADMALLQTRQPMLVSKAISHIFRGSSMRVAVSACLVFLALSAAWVIVAALGRAVSLREIFGHFRVGEAPAISLRSLLGIHFLRATLLLAALVGFGTAMLAAGAVTSPSQPRPASAMIAFLAVTFIVVATWTVLNWILSLASIFVTARGCDTFTAIAAAVRMCGTRLGAVAAVSLWFGLAHMVAWFAASSVVAFPLGFASVLPAGIVLGGVLFVTLLYLAVVDYLYLGRLAAYIAILELSEAETVLVKNVAEPPLSPRAPSSRIDPDELILSDVPV
jgi:hypothetical protein